MARTVDIPHLLFPLRLTEAGTLAVLEQDTIEDVRQCVTVLLRTPLQARPLAPEVGVPELLFGAQIDALLLAAALEDPQTGDPRARVTVTSSPPDEAGNQALVVRVALADGAAGQDPDATDMP